MPTNKLYGDWFRKTREAFGLTQQEVADALNVSKALVSQMETKGVSQKTVHKHAQTLGWTLPGTEELLQHLAPETTTSISITSLRPSAGSGTICDEEIVTRIDVPIDRLRRQYPDVSNVRSLALCHPKGDSMEGTFSESDTLLVDSSQNTFDVDAVYVFTLDDDLYVKRIQRLPGRKVLMVSDNPKYHPVELDQQTLEGVKVHARVVGKWAYSRL